MIAASKFCCEVFWRCALRDRISQLALGEFLQK